MSSVHEQILDLLAQALSGQSTPQARDFATLSRPQILRAMFANFRLAGAGPRGFRLTWYGLDMMRTHFQSFDIPLLDEKPLHAREIIYLSRVAKFPYYFDNFKIVMFDTDLGFRIRLVDGDVSALMRMETD